MAEKKNNKKSVIASTSITLAIVVLLIISGIPVLAVSVIISGLQDKYTQGTDVNFTVSIEIKDPDRHVPARNISVNITGPANKSRIFALNGTPISGDANITITPVSIPAPGDFGYGYGYGCDNLTGDCYRFGYGYGYGTGVNLTYVYNITVNSTYLPLGIYTTIASLNTGMAAKPSFNSPSSTFNITSPLPSIQISMEVNPKSINPNSMGRIKATIFNDTPPGFDVSSINISTVRFGPSGASEVHNETTPRKLILHFNTQDTGIGCGDTQVTLTGKTFGGRDIVGIDSIRTIDCTISASMPVDPATGRVNRTVTVDSPSGEVVITIPNGTLATLNGTPLANISINSTSALPASARVALSANDRVVGEIVNLGPAGAVFSPPIQIRFNYTEPLPNNVNEDNLQVRFFNASTNSWEILTIVERNTSLNYIIANVSHFSIFTLLGTVSAGAPGGGGSGAGTGGGGVVTSEPYDNIAKAERYDKSLIANTPVTYAFKVPELSIYEIAVTGKESENDIAVRVEALKGTSKLVKEPASGAVYRNVNVWAGTKRIKEVLIRFKVENSWLDSNSLADSEVRMVKWDGSKWIQLENAEKTKDSTYTYTYYEAKTDTLSSFAIVGLKGGVMPTGTPAVEVTETPVTKETAPTATPTEKVPGFGIALAMATLSALYMLNKRRR